MITTGPPPKFHDGRDILGARARYEFGERKPRKMAVAEIEALHACHTQSSRRGTEFFVPSGPQGPAGRCSGVSYLARLTLGQRHDRRLDPGRANPGDGAADAKDLVVGMGEQPEHPQRPRPRRGRSPQRREVVREGWVGAHYRPTIAVTELRSVGPRHRGSVAGSCLERVRTGATEVPR